MDIPRACADATRKVCDDFGAELPEITGHDDHVHLLAGYPPTIAVPAPVNSLKGVSARRLRTTFTGRVNPAPHARASLVPVLPHRVPRRRAAEHHPALHQTAKNAGQPGFRANPP